MKMWERFEKSSSHSNRTEQKHGRDRVGVRPLGFCVKKEERRG
jgi:hypothetical protein